MNPVDFCDLASELAKSDSPAKLRTAISRAYYAAHHVGANLLRNLGFTLERTGKAHTQVQHRLLGCGVANKDVRKAGVKLGGLQSERTKADYHLNNDSLNSKTVEAHVKTSREIIEILGQCTSGEKRKSVTEEIKEYERKTRQVTFE